MIWFSVEHARTCGIHGPPAGSPSPGLAEDCLLAIQLLWNHSDLRIRKGEKQVNIRKKIIKYIFLFYHTHIDNIISEVIKKSQQSIKTALTPALHMLNLPAFCFFLSTFLSVIFVVEGRKKFITVLKLILLGNALLNCSLFRSPPTGRSSVCSHWEADLGGTRSGQLLWDILQTGSLGKELWSPGLPRAYTHMHIHDWLFFQAKEKISLENYSSRTGLCFQVFCLSQKKIADAMKSFVQP